MAATFGQVVAAAMDLPPRERIDIAYALLESVSEGEHDVRQVATVSRVERLLEVARELSPHDRADLAHVLLDSVDDEDADDEPADVTAEWADEIERRVAEIRAGTAVTYAAAEVMAELRARFG